MDIFKIGKGSFWGVIIPGGFLYANIFFVFYRDILEQLLSQSGLFVLLSLLLSYISGNILRIIQPRVAEMISIPIQIIVSLLLRVLDAIRNLLKIRELSWLKPKSFKWILQDFPYMEWFYTDYLERLPKRVKIFFNRYKKKEFSNKLERMDHVFFNYCKHYAIENTNHLRDDIYFYEGLTRFLNGMVYALIISIFAIFFKSLQIDYEYQPFKLILIIYLIVLFLILIRYKTVRRLETATCFMSFYIAKNRNNDGNLDLDEKNLNNDITVQ